MPVEEQQGVEGLILSGRAYVRVAAQVREEAADLSRSETLRMNLAGEVEEAPYPGDVGPFGVGAVVP